MIPYGLVRAFLHQATEQGSRSTILKPLGWMMALLIAGMIASFYLTAPVWVIVLFAVFEVITMALYLFAYLYCIFTDKDALRSETYSIQKLAIEKGFVGDSIQGVFNRKEPEVAGLITEGATSGSEDIKSESEGDK